MINDKKVLFSGMQATGNLTLGNYLGALKNWKKMARDYDCIFGVADLHALGKIFTAEPLHQAVLGAARGHGDDAVAFQRGITNDLEHHVLGDGDRADIIFDLAFHGLILPPCAGLPVRQSLGMAGHAKDTLLSGFIM